MILHFCDRCGEQLDPSRPNQKVGKYGITRSYTIEEQDEVNNYIMDTTEYTRSLVFCPSCASELEKFLDDEFSQMPSKLCVSMKRRESNNDFF